MILPEKSTALRIFISEEASHKGRPLFEVIVNKAKDLGLAGATVYKGIMGFGADSRIHTLKFLRLSENLPVIIEIIDSEERIGRIIPYLEETVEEGLIFCENVKIIKYHRNKPGK